MTVVHSLSFSFPCTGCNAEPGTTHAEDCPALQVGPTVPIGLDTPLAEPRHLSTEEWWRHTSLADFEASLPKITEYGGTEEGSADLQIMGNALAELCGMHGAPDAVKQEMACWFYALGKISRLVSDYKQGKPGKADTWHDLTVYSMMARRLQEVGRWP